MSTRIRDPKQFIKAAEKELKRVMQTELSVRVSSDIDTYFLQDLWQWNGNTTFRENGEVVTSPRNIYDTGELYASERETFDFVGSRFTMTRTWGGSGEGDYADKVHNGTPKTEARPWTDVIAANHEQEYADLIEQAIAKALNAL